MKKIMMFLHSGSLNRGCEAIVRSGANIIKDEIKNIEINVSSFNPESDKLIPNIDNIYDGRNSEIKKYSYDWLLSSIRVKLFNDESYAYKQIHKNIIQHIDDMDVFLSIFSSLSFNL